MRLVKIFEIVWWSGKKLNAGAQYWQRVLKIASVDVVDFLVGSKIIGDISRPADELWPLRCQFIQVPIS
jgi:hypothetical protein